MKPTNVSGDSEEILSASLSKCIRRFSGPPDRSGGKKGAGPRPPPALAAFAEAAQQLALAPERVAKVTKDRVFSLAVHPTPEKVVACAGDKWGGVGVWDVVGGSRKPAPHNFPPAIPRDLRQ